MPKKHNPTHTAILVEFDDSYTQENINEIKKVIQEASKRIRQDNPATRWATYPAFQEKKFDPEWGGVTIYQP